MTVGLSKRGMIKEIVRLKKELEEEKRLSISAGTSSRSDAEKAHIANTNALYWELKAKTYRAAFIFIVAALVVAMAVIIALAVYFR